MKYLSRIKYSTIYMLTVVLINMAFQYIPPVVLYDSTIWSIGSLLAGAVFVARDYAQKEIGHKVLFLTIVSGCVSYYMASPVVAIASMSAFAVSELSDYIIYTNTKGSFNKKVVMSSLIGVPVDTVVFLSIISSLSAFSFVVMVASKLIVLSFYVRKSNEILN